MTNLKEYVKKGLFYKSVVEDGSDIIFIVDYDGEILYHNDSVEETLGYKPGSLVGQTFFELILPETLADFKKEYKASTKKRFNESIEFQFLCKDGSYKYLEFNSINLKHKEKIEGLILDCRDITQRKEDAAELLRAQKAKEQFLANVSHEIRTPINGIAGMATLLSQNPTEKEQATYLNAIKSAADNLKVIINDILDLASIESGKLNFEQIGFNINDLLRSIVDSFSVQSKQKGIDLSFSLEAGISSILVGDPFRLNQILINLISNALKFTHAGQIKIIGTLEKATTKTQFIKINVEDTGIGIPSDKLNTIFESFSQADASVTRKYGGTGLGLTIVKQLVELQKGKITVESEEDVGTTFSVVIPYQIGKTNDIEENASIIHRQRADQISLKNLRILLAEDNDINRLYATSILKMWECQTDVAENGYVALEKVRNNNYDLILMDIQMPVMDGFEATKAIRMGSAPKNQVPIIALTANATSKDIERCLSAGMNDCIGKPFTPENLFSVLVKFNQLKLIKSELKEPVAPQKLIDLSHLEKISGGNDDFIREIVSSFMTAIPKTVEEISTHMMAMDWINLEKVVHKVKPTLTMVGMGTTRDIAVEIETIALSEGDRDNKKIESLSETFCGRLTAALAELKEMGY
ncbi:MAG: ATP-binding protein [Cyclobacteriaceae bacterium]|nr:response regulator [Cyclobacteriaceae bacterium]